MRVPLCSILFFLLLLTACQSEKIHSLEELKTNNNNQLDLPVLENMEREQYLELFETFETLPVTEIETRLTTQAINLQEASFGFYYLANAYIQEDQIEQALTHHRIAAAIYLNPQSYLKLAEREYFMTKDYAQAFRYLHHALEIALEITNNNRSHPVAQNMKDKSQFLLQELELLAAKEVFDRAAVWEELKGVMPEVVERFRRMYHLEVEPVQ